MDLVSYGRSRGQFLVHTHIYAHIRGMKKVMYRPETMILAQTVDQVGSLGMYLSYLFDLGWFYTYTSTVVVGFP